jgi:hypothetical protein
LTREVRAHWLDDSGQGRIIRVCAEGFWPDTPDDPTLVRIIRVLQERFANFDEFNEIFLDPM